MLFFNTFFQEKFVLRFALLDHHFHHHLHFLHLISWWIHCSTSHHIVHCFHLNFLLGLKNLHGFLFCQYWGFIIFILSRLDSLLHLHYLHSLILILAVEHGSTLELLFRNAQFTNNLCKFVLNILFFLLGHFLNYLLISSPIFSFISLSSLRDQLFLFLGKNCFSIK